jgi:RHS repeat-associated protein
MNMEPVKIYNFQGTPGALPPGHGGIKPDNGNHHGGGNNGNGGGNGAEPGTDPIPADPVGAEKFIFYYHPDHLGSSSYISDANGEVSQHLEYFAFGETFVEEHSNTSYTPYLFNGKELDDETGLYYYSARYFDPKTSVFQSVDPLAEKFPNVSSYAYCNNNPINFIDPNGKEPTPYEAALMARHVYKGEGELVGGWSVSSKDDFNINNSGGLGAGMYQRTKGDGSIEYAYVYVGTEDLEDWGDNFGQPFGLSSQHDDVEELSVDISSKLKGSELTFVGHSLGGGLSNLSSLRTGRTSITFNPAWLAAARKRNAKKLGKGKHRTNYVHVMDPLNALQVSGGDRFGLERTGENRYILGGLNPLTNNPIIGHFMDTVIKTMEENGQTLQHRGNRNDGLYVPANPRDH